jgi:serine/threonine-protein kinase OSR1/STK39
MFFTIGFSLSVHPLLTIASQIHIIDIRLEVQTMRLSLHPNVLVCHTSFIHDTHLWLVTQLMSKGSSLHCLQSARAQLLTNASSASNNNEQSRPYYYTSDDSVLEGGLTAYASLVSPESLLFEAHITYILYETLLGLKYIHDNGQIHRDIKAGNLLLDGDANVRIADFGVSSWLIDSGNRREHTTTFVGTPCWMAPEVLEQVDGYDYKADIWSLGITALELCKGYAPYAKYAPMKVLLLTIQEDPPTLETYNDGDDANMWSKSFRSMIKLCLQKDPSKRPTCQELLAHRHFKPLSSDEGRVEWRQNTKKELCDVVQDVGKLSGTIRCVACRVH